MKRVLALAETTASYSLRLIAVANILFLLTFFAVFVVAAGKARAEDQTCGGKDLFAELATSDPAELTKLRAEADRTPNGKGLLWKIEKAGVVPSFLFGTMHMTDPRVVGLTPPAQAAFDAAKTVVIETTDILDQQAMMAGFIQHPELMMFTDQTTLASLMSAEDAAAMNKGLESRGIPPASVAKMKPWMLSAMVALPACELARKAAGAPVLDIKLAEDARKAGKQLLGLETAISQLQAMASLPMDFHVKGLVETLKLGDRMDDVIETMIVLYARGETGLFWPLFHATLPESTGDGVGYTDFEETMIDSRNVIMATNAAPILDTGGAFVAVGALHLPGEKGLIELLRKAGYSVSPAG